MSNSNKERNHFWLSLAAGAAMLYVGEVLLPSPFGFASLGVGVYLLIFPMRR